MSQPQQGSSAPPATRGLGARLKRAFGPMLAGLAIDALDLMTFGPIGIYTGMILGGITGWWLAPELGFPQRMRWVCALLTGVYCTIPLTGFLPLAAVVAGASRLFEGTAAPGPAGNASDLDPEGAIEAEYVSDWDDPASR